MDMILIRLPFLKEPQKKVFHNYEDFYWYISGVMILIDETKPNQ